MTEPRKELLAQLERARDLANRRAGYAYTCGEDFVLRHGQWYEGPYVYKLSQGPAKQCYGWSLALSALHGLKYIEGYALAPQGIAIPHAWNSFGQDPTLLDAVWMNTGLAYFGVEFSVERADDALWNGDACVLDDWKRRWPLFRDPWKGEDFSLRWPPSIRLEAFRERSRGKAMRILRSIANER